MKQSIKLTKEYAQFAPNQSSNLESALSITVMYNPKDKEVEYVYSVTVYNYEKKVHTDISAIMGQNLEDMLNDMVDSVSWDEVYRDTCTAEAALENTKKTLNPVFDAIFTDLFKNTKS